MEPIGGINWIQMSEERSSSSLSQTVDPVTVVSNSSLPRLPQLPRLIQLCHSISLKAVNH